MFRENRLKKVKTRRSASADRTARRHVLPMGVGPFAFGYQGNLATPCQYIDTTQKEDWLRYNFAADSF